MTMNKYHRRLLNGAMKLIKSNDQRFVCLALFDALQRLEPDKHIAAYRDLKRVVEAQLDGCSTVGSAIKVFREPSVNLAENKLRALRCSWIRWMRRQPDLLTMPLDYDTYLRGKVARTFKKRDQK